MTEPKEIVHNIVLQATDQEHCKQLILEALESKDKQIEELKEQISRLENYRSVGEWESFREINSTKVKEVELKFQAARNVALDWITSETETRNNTPDKIEKSVDQEIEEEVKRLKEK